MSPALALAATGGLGAHWGGGPGFGGIGWLFVLVPLFWIAVVAALFAVMRRRMLRRGYGFAGSAYLPEDRAARSAEATLAERFAKGDIEEVEYRARLEVLRANRGERPRDL